MRHDPFSSDDNRKVVSALENFTGRDELLKAFNDHLSVSQLDQLQVLVFYGVGGIGKSKLIQKFADDLHATHPTLPQAKFDFDGIGDQTQAYREVLLRLRSDLGNTYGVRFPKFDLCLSVILAREGGSPPPLVQLNPNLSDSFQFLFDVFKILEHASVPLAGAKGIIERKIRQDKKWEKWVRFIGNTAEVLELRQRALEDDKELPQELMRRFAEDLRDHLPARQDGIVRALLFLDTYEALWTGREKSTSAQAKQLEEWVIRLAEFCLKIGVLLVINGREALDWAEYDPDWDGYLDQHHLVGLSADEAQLFLARCLIGPYPVEQLMSPLQEAVIGCCNTTPTNSGAAVSCHCLHLALCAQTILNHREDHVGNDPAPEMFRGIPIAEVAYELAQRFLRSLHSGAMENMVRELSLAPRFNEQAVLDFARRRDHNTGRWGWEQLISFVFVEEDVENFYRLHKTMRDVLRFYVPEDVSQLVHNCLALCWKDQEEISLEWYHRWRMNPERMLDECCAENSLSAPQQLLKALTEIDLEADRSNIGNYLWAKTNVALGKANSELQRPIALTQLIAATTVFSEEEYPEEWAGIQKQLGEYYHHNMSRGQDVTDRATAADHYKSALKVFTKEKHLTEWILLQYALGGLYNTADSRLARTHLLAALEASTQVHGGDFSENGPIWREIQTQLGTSWMLDSRAKSKSSDYFRRAKYHFDLALDALKNDPTAQWAQWSTLEQHLGNYYAWLPNGDPVVNMRKALDMYLSARSRIDSASHPVNYIFFSVSVLQTSINLFVVKAQQHRGNIIHVEPLRWAAEDGERVLQLPCADEEVYWFANLNYHTGLVYSRIWHAVRDSGALLSARKHCITAMNIESSSGNETDVTSQSHRLLLELDTFLR